ncbi:concanavalin A-like lectin/glucanase domain-containing protein [Aspergillus ambiguus]|uniref:glycoside hydrolase family 16 protein n=1 Tax=Aspergillus ambiguus TaxID=176160 RepID=UPI003CCDA256
MYFKYATAAIAAVLPLCSAQTFSKCNPLEKTCPANKGLSSSTFTSNLNNLDGWTTTAGTVNTGADGATFTINKKGDAPTIDTNFYFLFGKAEVVMKAAPGTGIVSSIVLESDVLDEIDWEALGGDNTQIQTNYFGKGDTSSYDRATYVGVAGGPQNDFHTYTVDWSKDQIQWSIDGNVVRTLAYTDAKGGSRFPQTPMRLRLGIWAGGDPDNAQGTIEWAGGATDYSQAPFSMYVKSVRIENSMPADSYTYSDNSGSWQSIQTKGGSGGTSSASSSSSSSSTSESSTSSSSTSESSTEETTAAPTTTGAGSTTASGITTAASPSGTDAGSTTGGGSSSETGAAGGAGGSSTAGGSSSGTAAASSASPSVFDGAASTLAGSSMGAVSVFGFIAAMLQL